MYLARAKLKNPLKASFPLLAACALGAVSPDARAFGFGELQVKSYLGEDFSATVAILGDDTKDINAACFTLRTTTASENHDLPTIPGIQIEFQRIGNKNSPILALRSRQGVNEPMAWVGIQAGCGISLAREYVVMLSPRVYEDALLANIQPLAASPADKTTTGSGNEQARLPDLPVAATAVPAAPAAMSPDKPGEYSRAAPAQERKSTPPHRSAARHASTAGPKPGKDRVQISTPSLPSEAAVPPKKSKSVNLTVNNRASAEKEISSLKSALEQAEESRQKELQTIQSLEVHVISLQKEMEDLKLQIKYKEELEKKLLAQADQSRFQLFTSADKGGSPSEFLWALLIVGGVGAASAFGTYAALTRQKRKNLT